jgi:hypothetical protein
MVIRQSYDDEGDLFFSFVDKSTRRGLAFSSGKPHVTMSRAIAKTTVTRRHGVVGHVCARRDWSAMANFAGHVVIEGTKRQPQPTTYEGKAPDA